MINRKEYLGDGVYANYSGFDITLTTEDGISVQNIIVLDGPTLEALERYLNQVKAFAKEAQERAKAKSIEGQ